MNTIIVVTLLAIATVAWGLAAFYWRHAALLAQQQAAEAQQQAADMRLVSKRMETTVNYCIAHFVPIIAVIGHWPPNVVGPPEELRKEALAAMQGAIDVGITVQAHTTITNGPMRLH